MTGRATTTSLTEAGDLHRRLGELGAARRQLEEKRQELDRAAGEALMAVRDSPHLTIGGAAGLLEISRGTAYERLEEERHRRAGRKRRRAKGAGR